MTEFSLAPQLQHDTYHLASWPLSEVLLMNDEHYPWVILVPRVAHATEMYELSPEQRQQLDAESIFLGQGMMRAFGGHKLNVAALGNVVRQLHIHHVVRFETDAAWPAPVWGRVPVRAMEHETLVSRRTALTRLFDDPRSPAHL